MTSFSSSACCKRASATPAQVQAALGASAIALGTQVATLNAAGARYILAWNLPDVGRTPGGVASGNGAAISQLTAFYNSTLNATLDAAGVQAIRLNTFAFFNEVLANPGSVWKSPTRRTARVHGAAVVVVHAGYARQPECAANVPVRRRISSDDGGTPNCWPTNAYSFIAGPQQIAALGDAPFRCGGGKLPRRRWTHVVEPQYAARQQTSSKLGSCTTTTTSIPIYLGSGSNHGKHDRRRR
jgi:outer membrane lipase/esterase